jgi:hypothetical protein
MYIQESEIKNTKMIVYKRDINAVQKVLFKCGYGFPVGLDKSFSLRKLNSTTAFYVNYAGEIETVSLDEYDDEVHFYDDFKVQPETEIHWTSLF